MTKFKEGDKVTHVSHGAEVGVVGRLWCDDTFNVYFSDGEYSFDPSEFVRADSLK
jgi:hypothetical protein